VTIAGGMRRLTQPIAVPEEHELFGFGNREAADATETSISVRRSGLIAFLKRRINPIAADREEKYARLEARVASETATGEHYNQLGDLKLEKGLPEDALELYKRACNQFVEEDLIVKAIAVAKKILKQFPDDVCVTDMYLRLGELNQQRGMIANAKEAYLVAAQRYQEAGTIPEALRVFQRLADLLPDNHELNGDLAKMYSKEGMGEEASAQFARTAIRLLEGGDYRQAKELCLASLAQQAGNRDALKALLQIAFHEQDYKEADAYVSRLGSYMESEWTLLKAYGDLLARQERHADAIVQYEKAVNINPMNPELAAALEGLRGSQRDGTADAPQEVSKQSAEVPTESEEAPVFDLDDSSVGDFDPTDLVEDADGAEEAALATAGPEGAPEGQPEAVGGVELEDYGAVFESDTQTPTPEDAGATEGTPQPDEPSSASDDTEFQKKLAEAKFYEELGMDDEAKEAYEELLAEHPDHPALAEAGSRLGLAPPTSVEESESLPPEAAVAAGVDAAPASDAEVEAEEETTDAVVGAELTGLLAEADIYLAGTLFAEAIEIYERILAADPAQPDALAGLQTARSLNSNADLHREEVEFENNIENQMTNLLANLVGESGTDEEDPALHLEMAASYLEMDMADEALAELQIVAAASQPPVEMHLAFARCHGLRGDHDQAVACYEKFLQQAPAGMRANDGRYELAVLLLELSESIEARRHLEILCETQPDFRDAKELLAGISAE
jgi:tetratricopeptide (TPR) repeat protein